MGKKTASWRAKYKSAQGAGGGGGAVYVRQYINVGRFNFKIDSGIALQNGPRARKKKTKFNCP